MNHKRTIAWWEKQAPTYFTDKIFSFSNPIAISKLNIQPEWCILEIGFGYGRELSQYCGISHHVHGVELFECTCELARKSLLGQGITELPSLVTYDGKTLPYNDDSFDVIHSCFVIQHMSRKAAKELIREALRVVTHGGQVLMEFFGDPEYRHQTEDRFSGDPEIDGMYNNAYTKDDIISLVSNLGRVLWIDPQRVFPGSTAFDNHWLCITKD